MRRSWPSDTSDWEDSASVGSVVSRLNNARDGSIILMPTVRATRVDTVAAVHQWLSSQRRPLRVASCPDAAAVAACRPVTGIGVSAVAGPPGGSTSSRARTTSTVWLRRVERPVTRLGLARAASPPPIRTPRRAGTIDVAVVRPTAAGIVTKPGLVRLVLVRRSGRWVADHRRLGSPASCRRLYARTANALDTKRTSVGQLDPTASGVARRRHHVLTSTPSPRTGRVRRRTPLDRTSLCSRPGERSRGAAEARIGGALASSPGRQRSARDADVSTAVTVRCGTRRGDTSAGRSRRGLGVGLPQRPIACGAHRWLDVSMLASTAVRRDLDRVVGGSARTCWPASAWDRRPRRAGRRGR